MIKALHLDAKLWSVDDEGLMTPTFKLKRPQLQKKYQAKVCGHSWFAVLHCTKAVGDICAWLHVAHMMQACGGAKTYNSHGMACCGEPGASFLAD